MNNTCRGKILNDEYNDVEGYKQYEIITTNNLKYMIKVSNLTISSA